MIQRLRQADAFLAVAQQPGFWEELEQESLWETVLALEPPSSYRWLPEARLEEVALAFADFADLKSPYAAGHSRRVGDQAARLARRLALPEPERVVVRRAALVHDVGLAAIPSLILDKPRSKLTQVEWERLRLHPYHAERILSRVPALAPVVPLVAAHHERPDGRGYYRGLSGAQIPLGAQLIAVADTFDELTHDAAERPALAEAAALAQLQREAGSGLAAIVVEALAGELGLGGVGTGGSAAQRPARQQWPAGLSDREVEILRLVARGLSRKELAAQLVVSEHTVRHHLEHIYNKVGVSTRVGATLFAIEHGLLG